MRLSPEFRLFCLALRRPLREEDRAALHEEVAAVLRWETVLAGAARHAVAPLLLAGLRDGGVALPPSAEQALRRLAVASARLSLLQATALRALVARFAAADVPLLVLKGVPLSRRLYGESALRSASDIDLLVDPAQFGRAAELLAETGHRRRDGLPAGSSSPSDRHWCKEVEYLHPVHGRVELHHRLTDLPELLPWDFATLWRGRGTVMLDTTAVPVLGPRHLALYLCAHGAEHAWERLRWLTDLAALLREPGELDAAIAAADATGLAAPMLQAVGLAHDWLALPVPTALRRRVETDRRVRGLNRLLAHSYAGEVWYAMPPRGSLGARLRYSLWQRLYRLSIKPVWRYRLRLVRRDLFSPADRAALPLPVGLTWLYPLIRPFGWLLRRRLN